MIYSSTGDTQAAYWNSPLSRKEAQDVFDQYGSALTGLSTATLRLDAAVAFLMERLGVTPEEFQAWVEKHSAQPESEPTTEQQPGA